MGNYLRNLAFLLLFGFGVNLWGMECDPSLYSELARNEAKLLKNEFNVNRGFREYESQFGGEKFLKELRRMDGKGHWLDVGAGNANAQMEYLNNGVTPNFLKRYPESSSKNAENKRRGFLESTRLPSALKSECTAVSFVKPNDILDLPDMAKFRYLEGRYIEDIPNAELKKADLITDFFGAATYSSRLGVVIQKYLDLLNEDGVIFLAGMFENFSGLHGKYQPLLIYTRDGKELTLVEWLKRVPGIKVETFNGGTLKITKKAGADPQLPELEVVRFETDTPPKRGFREK